MGKKYRRGRRKLFPGTDKKAFRKGAKGKTSKERSKIYHREKRKNKIKKVLQALFGNGNLHTSSSTKMAKKPTQKKEMSQKVVTHYRYKKTVLDSLRNYRSPGIISDISNSLAAFIVKTTGQGLDDKTKNILRSTIAFVSSEVVNKIFEEEIVAIERVKLFIKIGKTIYKIGILLDEEGNSIKWDDKIKPVSTKSWGYKRFLRKHPTIASYYDKENCLSKQEILSGRNCAKKLILAKKEVEQNPRENAPNLCEYYYYCHGIEKEKAKDE